MRLRKLGPEAAGMGAVGQSGEVVWGRKGGGEIADVYLEMNVGFCPLPTLFVSLLLSFCVCFRSSCIVRVEGCWFLLL